MHPEQWQQIDQLFHVALERAPEARAAWLATACQGDLELQREVGRLLTAHEHPGEVWEVSASDLAAEWLSDQPPTSSLIGQQIGHYKIESLLGKGGMGEVYLAQDTQLHRKVALKLLPPEFGQEPERVRRFEREAQAVSSLNHPNILTIYEIGASNDLPFIVTEYMTGQTLHQMLSTAPMKLEQALIVTTQIAQALVAAHGAGIIHRDIKPENVIVRPDGLVKVLDFGLAKLVKMRISDFGMRNEDAEPLVQSPDGNPHSAFRNPPCPAS